MSDPETAPDAELARARELAVAFMLDEIDEAGLRELHALLTGPRATAMAAAAWQQLDGAIDLRVQVGGANFADEVRLRLGDDGAFARAAQRRLGGRSALAPVGEPPPPPRRWRRRLLWFCLPMLGGMLLTWLALRSEPPARASAIAGLPVAGGAAVVPGSALDPGAPLAVPDGAAVAITWRDGSMAVIAGPASAVIQPGGLSLIGGSAWLAAGPAGLRLGAPDRQAALPDGTRCAVVVADGASAIALPAGAQAIPGLPTPGRFASAGSEAPWPPPQTVGGVVPLEGAWWELGASVAAWHGDGRLVVTLEPGPSIALAPGVLLVGQGGPDPLAGAQATRLPGATQSARSLQLSMRDRRLSVTVDGVEIQAVDLAARPSALRIERNGLDGPAMSLRHGPGFTPPLPLSGW
jgi:hypothetical protein